MNRKTRKKSDPIPYTEAVEELETILEEIEGADVDLDRLAGRVERASELVRLLKARIRETELKVTKVVEELREDDAGAATADADEESGEAFFEENEEGGGGFTREVPF